MNREDKSEGFQNPRAINPRIFTPRWGATLLLTALLFAAAAKSGGAQTNTTVVTWGDNEYGQANVPAGLADAVAIAGGEYHSLALKSDGTVVAWGDNEYGQTDVPTDLTNVVAIAGGWLHSLALKANGTVVAWGYNEEDQTNVPPGLTNAVAIAGGGYHSLALKGDGTVAAWGWNGYGQTDVPTDLTNVVAIATGYVHNLALKGDGTVVAWGGYGETNVPPDLTNAVAIAGGWLHSLALKGDSTVVAWGSNANGQTNVPTDLTNVVAIAGGGYHSLALKGDGTVVAWGRNDYGQTNVPAGLANVVAIAGGGYHSLALVSCLPPTITSQPASQSVLPGTNVTFSVSATGGEPLSYQWRLNGANIPGATNSVYTNSIYSITNVQPGDGGSYDVLVANPGGAVASLIARLKVTVGALPFADNFASRGGTNGLSGVGGGSNTNATREAGEPYHAGKFGNHSVWLQWTAPANGVATFNTRGSSFDTLLAVYTGTSLGALTVVAANDDEGNGRFTSQVQFNAVASTNYIIAVDGLGSANGDIVLSWNLVANVAQIPMIVTQPADVTVSPGSNAFFSVSATCNTNLTYQWYYNDSLAISGATSASLTVSNVGLSNVGLYRVNVTSAAGQTVVSEEGSLEIGPAGAHSFDKFEDLLASLFGGEGFAGLGGKGFLAALSGGFPSVSAGSSDHQDISIYNATTDQGEPIQNGTGGATRWYLLTATDNSTFMLDTMGSAISNIMAVYTLTNRNISSLQLVTSDRKNSAPDGTNSMVRFPGKPGTNYLIAVAPAVNGVQGIINLDWHVGIPPSVIGAGQTQAVGKGTTLAFQGGDPNAIPAPSYRWLWNGANIPGATSATYSLPNIQYNQGGTYSVVVSNFLGVVTNVIAFVSVDAPLKLDVSALPANVRIWGSATQGVVLQLSTNLTLWKPLYTNPSPLLPVNYLDTNTLTRPDGYYRLKRWP